MDERVTCMYNMRWKILSNVAKWVKRMKDFMGDIMWNNASAVSKRVKPKKSCMGDVTWNNVSLCI